ncbi:hypothetical protein [Rhizobium sp. WYJ-E13]|uniref:hypothetical protein n=1 Tax=Rhizobium sp. WYJ-E13 TaxID=2849093 RepID=UPI001C1F1D4B|nr:hypothetical protein [Rhizobium sp. WYJ-E13]QWW71511.1 hypothetical protein KQ933_23025 [Rhizobium sp. WYJ-E13]
MSSNKPPAPLSDDILALRLGLTTREFQRYRGQGLIVVTVTEEDENTAKVTCQLGNRIWEGFVANGEIIVEGVRFTRGMRSKTIVS